MGGLIPPGDPGYDRLSKVQGVLDMIEEKFASLYNPSRENAIDEAMVPYKGRSSLKGRQQQWLCLPIPSLHWKGDISRDRTGSKGG